jgi:hypothetical protein
MTEAKYTPGPWIVNPFNAWVELPGVNAPICAMLWRTELRSEDETLANARLIAAAPELVETLRALVEACSLEVEEVFEGEIGMEMLTARALLTRIDGEDV